MIDTWHLLLDLPELAVLGGKLPVLGGALPLLSVWVFASFFVKVTEFLVNVPEFKGVWWRLLHPENLHECFDRYWLIIWSDETQLKHNLFFLTNCLRSSTEVAFNTVQSEILWVFLQNQYFNFLSSEWGLPDCDWELLAFKRSFLLPCFNLFDLSPWLPYKCSNRF